MKRLGLIITLLLTGLAAAPGAHAASAGSSYSLWSIDGAQVRVRVILPMAAVRALAAPGAPTPGIDAVSADVGQQVAVSSSGGDCEAIDQGEGVGQVYTLALTPVAERFEMIFDCPSADGLVLQNHLLLPGDHIGYARIQSGAGAPRLAVFTADRQSLNSRNPQGAGPIDFMLRGARSALTDPLRLAAILGLALLALNRGAACWAGAALGAGYLASLAFALFGLEIPDAMLAIAAMGGLAAGLGLVLLGRRLAPTLTRRRMIAVSLAALVLIIAAVVAGWAKHTDGVLLAVGVAIFVLTQAWLAGVSPGGAALAALPAAAFGLLDGLTSASDLVPLSLPAAAAAPALAARDLGAIVAVIAVTAALAALRWLARKAKPATRLATEAVGAGLIGLGLFWFVMGLNS